MIWAVAAATAQPVIDGNLNDAFWQKITAQKLTGEWNKSPDSVEGGEIRVIVAGRFLYIGARLPEPEGRFVARALGRNPIFEEEDLLRIKAGPDIGFTDRVLHINPLGAYSVERDRQILPTHAERYLVATSVGEREWSAEVAIPLNEIGAPRADSAVLHVQRIRAMRPGSPEQRWRWPERGPAARVMVAPDEKWDGPAPVFRPVQLGNSEPPLAAGRREVPPVDSGWDAAGWRDVPAWSLLRNEPLPRLPREATEIKVIQDGRTLAVLARCAARSMPAGETFHVYLSTTGSTYAQFVLDPENKLATAAGFSGGPRISRPRDDWKIPARAHAWKQPGEWLARIDIPLDRTAEVLGEPRLPSEWRILFQRSRPAQDDEPREISLLPVTESDTALCPWRYRRLVLAEKGQPISKPREPEFNTRVLSEQERRDRKLPSMIEAHIRSRVDRITASVQRQWEQVSTREDWERFRKPKIDALAAMFSRFPARAALKTRVTKEFVGEGYRRQDLVYQSRPGLWVTANLYLPIKSTGKVPGIVVVHSHHRPRTQAELQDMGILWARVGSAVLIMDQIGHGERSQSYTWNREDYHSRYLLGMQLYLTGESLLQWMVWDIIRGVDLLLDRPDIDAKRVIMLGAVAAGGEPALVAAALDPRIAAVAPFNFGRAAPGWGSWESTRNLRRSIVDQFFPWVIGTSVAPRRFVYSNEMGWNPERHAAWAWYQKIFGLYGAPDLLDEAHGFGTFPGPGECTNIGPPQRKTLYPELQRWFEIPTPAEEPRDRRPEPELLSLNPDIAADLGMRRIHDLAREMAHGQLETARKELSRLQSGERGAWLQARWREKLGDIEPNRQPAATLHWKKRWLGAEVEGMTLQVEPGILVPMLLLQPPNAPAARRPVVIAISEGGKERLAVHESDRIQALLKAGIAICLPDVRGVGETSPDARRGPFGAETSLAATELMLGNTLLGSRLKDLRTVLAYVSARPDIDPKRIGVWGDSFVPVNPQRFLLDESPNWAIGPEVQRQAEPLGGLLAVLAGLYEDVRALAVRRGLVSYASILDDRFAYVPSDIIVPGILEAGDLSDVVAAIAPRPVLLESLVDARNRPVPQRTTPPDLVRWFQTSL
jgi:cephalosporin-C deacetylase-like acetyl esterase